MFTFLAGLFLGAILGVVALAICVASGRADLDLKIFNLELENKAATDKIEELMGLERENAELKREIKG